MATVGQGVAQPVGDAERALQYAAGDDPAAADLLERHRDAVSDSGPSPFFESLEVSGERALAALRAGDDPSLPFRVTWLALHTQGALPSDEERRNPVWDAFCTLPLAEQTALWHREVEGQETTEVSRLLGTSTDEVRRNLAAAYAAVRARVEQVPATSRGVASHLLLLQYSLRDTLAGVVLGPAAGRYLAARPRVGRRVPIEATPTRHHRPAPYVVGLAASVVGVVAAVSFLGSGQVPTGTLPSAEAAPFDAPIVGSYLEAVAAPPKAAPRDRAPQAGSAVTSSVVSTTGGGSGSGGTDAGPSGGAATGSDDQQPGGTNQPGPGPAPADNGPGQGVDHASDNGVANGVRAHGNGNQGKGASNANGAGTSKGNSKGKAKARGRR